MYKYIYFLDREVEQNFTGEYIPFNKIKELTNKCYCEGGVLIWKIVDINVACVDFDIKFGIDFIKFCYFRFHGGIVYYHLHNDLQARCRFC